MALIDNLVSYWKLDESSGNAADSHGSNTLTNNGSITYVAAKINNGADLEASSSQVFSITDAAQSGLDFTGNFSISMWVNPESITGTHGLVTKFRDSATFKSYRLSFDTTDMFLTISDNGTAETNATWSNPLTTGSLQHLALAYNAAAGEATLYYNGTAISTQTGLATSIANTSSIFRLGSRSSSTDTAQQFYDGIIDEVGVWSKTLTSDEVTQLYNSGSGFAYPFANAYSLAMGTGAYTYTGVAVGLNYDAASGVWANVSKNNATFSNTAKNSETFSNVSKNSATWANVTKN